MAVAKESMNRRLVSWTASFVSLSKVRPAAYSANRAASVGAGIATSLKRKVEGMLYEEGTFSVVPGGDARSRGRADGHGTAGAEELAIPRDRFVQRFGQ